MNSQISFQTENNLIGSPYTAPNIRTSASPITLSHVVLSPSQDGYDLKHDEVNLYGKSCRHFNKESGIELESFETLHRHDYFELIYVLDGEMDMLLEDKCYHYNKGDLCLLNRNIRHTELFRSKFALKYFFFRADFLQNWLERKSDSYLSTSKTFDFMQKNFSDDVKKNKAYINFTLVDPTQAAVPDYIWNSIAQVISPQEPGFYFFILGWLCRLLSCLDNDAVYQFSTVNLGTLSESNLTEEIISYIKLKNGRVNSRELADAVNYNGNYISRVFKKQTGKTIVEYCHEVSMLAAAQLLKTTDKNTQLIMQELGYKNRTHFNNLFFQNYGMTPIQYRKNFREDNQE